MEGYSKGEGKKLLEEENKVKHKMKSASQLEIMEKAYAAEAYSSEAFRAELSVKLGLSDRQLHMWLYHWRQKDRKASPIVNKAVAPIGLVDAQYGMMGFTRMGGGLPAMEGSSYREAYQTLQELRAVALVERQLGETLRKDGPILVEL